MEHASKFDLISLYLSGSAVVISIVALVWSVWRDIIADKVKVEVSIKIGAMYSVATTQSQMFLSLSEQHGRKTAVPKVLVTAINVGRREVVINQIYLREKKAHPGSPPWSVLVTRELPKAVAPYHEHAEYFDDASVIKELESDNIAYMAVRDTKRKVWIAGQRDINRIRTEYLSWRASLK